MQKLKTRLGQMAVATMLATGLLLVAQIDSADAAFSGKNGVIAFESERDGAFEVYKMKADGSVARNVTQKPSNPDQNPSWQAR